MEVSYPELLQSQLGNLMKTESAPDVIFLLGKNKVVRRGHSTILKVRSGFFASALRTNCWKETAHDYKFVKENIEPSTFDILLEYMYTGKIIISMDNLSSVVNAAAELQLAEFFPACETYACKELGSKSVFDMITLAYLHRLDTLWLTAMEYFDAHAESLLKEEGFLSLSEDLVLEVLSRDCVNVGELDIWRAVVRYVYHKCGLDYHECPLLKIPSWPGRLWVEIIKDQQTGHDRPTGGDMENEEAKEDFVRQRDDKSQDIVVAIPQSTLQSLRGTILPLLPAVRFSGIRINDFGRLIQGTRLLPHDLCIQVYEYHALAPMISASKDDAVRYGHSQILAARSSYFDRALQPSWREASDGVFRKPNIEPRVFDLLLDYIYTDNIAVSMDIVSQLTDAAVELGLEDLVEGCVEYACNHFNDESWPGRLLVNTTKTVKQEMFSPDNDDAGASSDEDSEIDPVETKSSDIVVTMPRDHFQLLRAAIKTFLPVIRLTNVPIKDFVRCIEGTGFVSSTFCLGLYRYYALPEKYSSDYAFAPPRAVFSSFLPSEQWRALWSWVLQAMGRPPSSGPPKAKKLYRASTHGFTSKAFHEHCDKKGPTLTVALASTGIIVGGFNSESWKSREGYSFSKTTFLFFYEPETSIFKRCLLIDSPWDAAYDSASKGPTFGGEPSLSITSIIAIRCPHIDKALALQQEWGKAPVAAIRKPNLEPEAFDLVLQYLYTGQITVPVDMIPTFVDAAADLEIQHLIWACEDFACQEFNDSMVYDMLTLASRHNLTRLWDVAAKCFDTQATTHLENEGLDKLDPDLLMRIISRASINATELTLWKAVLRYAWNKTGQDRKKCPFLPFPKSPGRLSVKVVPDVVDQQDKPSSNSNCDSRDSKQRNAHHKKKKSTKNNTNNSNNKDANDGLSSSNIVESKDVVVQLQCSWFQSLSTTINTLTPAIKFTSLEADEFDRYVEGTGLLSQEHCLQVQSGRFKYTSETQTGFALLGAAGVRWEEKLNKKGRGWDLFINILWINYPNLQSFPGRLQCEGVS
ncbi:hypothetical protein DFQ26_002084 [Actinomortierella ambigua]|nr:hypothetical protein DFQ26_002084 [Actinomortierella ambigua]